MSKIQIEKVDNGYVVRISYPKDKRTLVQTLENKNAILDMVKQFLDEEL